MADDGTDGIKIAVSISGGGYRAAAWGLGALWCLADTGQNANVTMVSSVSGGSITNAHAGLGEPFRLASSDRYGEGATSLAGRLSGRVGAFRASLFVTFVATAASGFLLLRGDVGPALVAAGIGAAAGVVGAITSRDLVFGRLEMWLYIDLLLALAVLVAWAWPNALAVLGAVALLSVAVLGRGPVLGWSMGQSLRALTGTSSALTDLNADPLHVILATELRAGHHACFAPSFVYCFDLGLGAKPDLPVRTALQASANLPGAFPTRWIRTNGMAFRGGLHHARWMALSDGGVYDNMADQWPIGLSRRIARLRASPDVAAHPGSVAVLDDWAHRAPTFVIVANASGALGFRRVWTGALPLIGELLGLLQVKDVLYDNGNSVRRTSLIEDFDSGTPAGTLVHIASNPRELPERVLQRATSSDAALAGRATQALAYLDRHAGSRTEWQTIAGRVSGVGTQLWPLGASDTSAIVRAAYCQTMVNLHLWLGIELHDPPSLA